MFPIQVMLNSVILIRVKLNPIVLIDAFSVYMT